MMGHRAQRRWTGSARFLIALWLAASSLVLLGGTLSAAPLDDDVRRIAKQLRCPICESVSVADSPAELAVQMRGVIRSKLEAGQSEQEVIDYFVAAYGDSVLLEPPRRGLGLFAWFGPLAALLVGAGILGFVLRSWVRSGTAVGRVARVAAPPQPDDSAAARARAELDAVRKGLAS